ncbi:medium-chain acyl-CoA ligase ACSF2, mitochondrial-like [Ictalurus furcatus]|uniref:medium-chain acyl-CoA ligase ACSF2, mitochondrial-like n=1 Tax=Ictalurus furcatus TaxID=66913 RepID=UPI002350814C|nr:medium-chain acyl-CoA ligase ACSF2, mitochondrial-like [Ictalurus furcatus]
MLGIWGPNTYEWILFQFATAKAGIIMVHCNAVVCPTQSKSQRFYDMLRQICPELNTAVSGSIRSASLPDLRNVIVTDGTESGMLNVDDVMQAAESRHHQQLDRLERILSPEDPINIQFTSGTTGNPKGVTLSHHNIVNNAYFSGLRMGYNWRAKVVDSLSGQLLPLGQPGELLIRGYCVMQGYWDEPDRTQESISEDGWYKTGDIASLDQYGYCRIEGRMKDVINRGGEKIFPAEVEQFLHKHPKVKDVQVVGVKDDRLGEQVCACIKVAEGQHCTVEEIKAYCKDQISYFKIPHYVMFIESYPLTASGKIQKNKLRAEMENSLGL